MVVIVDLENEEVAQTFHEHNAHLLPHGVAPSGKPDDYHGPSPPIERFFCRNVVTRAFGQYPIVKSVVQHIDLNTLDSLARTSYLIHQSLIQCRSSLLRATLRCVNDDIPVDPDSTLQYRARAGYHYFGQGSVILSGNDIQGRAPYNGKSGQCARDLVNECRKCDVPVCRNCTIKRPSQSSLIDRHRRLCQTCADAPLSSLLNLPTDPTSPLSSDLIQRELCQCDQKVGVWLCQPCGRGIRTSDSDYSRIWRWRNQYGEVLGGLGTGIGEGDRGVICGREGHCLAAKEVEQETDCDAADAREGSPLSMASSSDNAPAWPATSLYYLSGGGNANGVHSHLVDERRTPSPMQLGPGYERHEIVGIGGVVKRKLVRLVRVGACVPEWEDERLRSEFLRRNRSGQVRSFCGWCCRVIPGKSDLAQIVSTGT
ncbi:hypothetical protein SODALDRAFT_357472 [Sodiomyces alkalinus F11]|uniref:Uncharacterized protein n=1 Tax=Sodiomyces alkalinus (strain CBS 110278 / VKM F-3762 / F11) TaxID=1314773 RepID=A0A3N2Q3U9_SODAK|nr:hypothetical protein SODALDRAFT_357472 [Sodiomyces alkalinus F11]ROT41430.1 hypothetical protein SODALDRAFT_357472 [Sodiomyces alkalinus F11]